MVGMFFTILVMIVVLFGYKINVYMVTSACVEDALAASNLASAVIDLEEYGRSHMIRIKDPQSAFLLYKEALCHNLKLDEFMNTTNREVIASEVIILKYMVYNVSDEKIDIYTLDGEGNIQEIKVLEIGEAETPDGVPVESTTIYSKVSFGVKGFGEQIYETTKEKSVDIVRCESE